MPRDPSTGMLIPVMPGEDPHNPPHGFQESKWLQYSDAIRKVLPQSLGKPVALTPDELVGKGPGQQSQTQAQTQVAPAAQKPVEVAGKSRQEIANLPAGTPLLYNGKAVAQPQKIFDWARGN